MFESDDYDQVLSQFEFPGEVTISKSTKDSNSTEEKNIIHGNENKVLQNSDIMLNSKENVQINSTATNVIIGLPQNIVSPKYMKRKMINTYFNHKNKRKFPGPAGLLTDIIEENKDETICQMELLTQDVDFTQNSLGNDLFESPLWTRLLDDLKVWNLKDVDTINVIKQKTMMGGLRRKAQTVIAFVEAVDRSVTDPLIIIRDKTGNIKGTLHRDAWSAFSQYIASECCALILWKPTILTTGAAFKKYYLNITLSNILAIYSSTVVSDEAENKSLPDGYSIVYENDYTVIKTQNKVQNTDGNDTLNSVIYNETNNLLDGLDSIFSDDVF